VGFECEIMNQFGCPNGELKGNSEIAAVLATSSIARYSYSYWHSVYKSSLDPWNRIFLNQSQKTAINWGQLWKKIKADFSGLWSMEGQTYGSYNIGAGVINAIAASS
jgi:hypothetical protein